jgi:dihydrofolate reductase
MAELVADLFISLDGFAKGVDSGPFFDYAGPELDDWVRAAVSAPHLMLMGRVTYTELAEMSGVDTGMDAQPKAVFSNTLREPLVWANTRLLSGDLAETIRNLKRDSDVPLRSIGSLTLVRGMLERGLVDRLRLMVFPLILGDAGREPALAGYPGTKLQLVDTTVLDGRLVMLEYAPA